MSNFSVVLTELMELKDSVNNDIIRRSGINRSTFFKIKNGTRHPSGRAMVDSIISAMRLTEEHSRLLIEAYEIDKIGAYRYYGLKEVSRFFMEEGRLSATPPVVVKIPEFRENEHIRVFRETSEVRAAVCGMMYEDSPQIRILEAHMNSLYAHMLPLASQFHPKTEFLHIYMMDDSDAVGLHHRLYNIECFRNVMDILTRTIMYSPRYYYSPVSALGQSECHMNFIMSDRLLLTYNDAFDSAVLYDEPELLALYRDIFEKYCDQSVCFAEAMEAPDFLWEQVGKDCEDETDDKVYCFYPGIASMLAFEDDKGKLPRYIKEGVMDREEFVKCCLQFGEKFRQFLRTCGAECHIICAANALERFARTGYVNDFPRELANALTEEERAAALRQWRKKSLSYNVQTLRQKCIPDTSSLVVIATRRRAGIAFFYEQSKKIVQILMKEPSIAGLIYEYIESLERDCVMEKSEYLSFVDGLIAGLGG